MKSYTEGHLTRCLIFIFIGFFLAASSFVNAIGEMSGEASSRVSIDSGIHSYEEHESTSVNGFYSTSDKQLARAQTTIETQDTAAPVSIAPVSAQQASSTGVEGDLGRLGYSLSALAQQGILVQGHNGLIPKRCARGNNGLAYSAGMAIKPDVTYAACPDGQQPIYERFKPAQYNCVVTYDQTHTKALAILAHEVSHCLYFENAQYSKFDALYTEVRLASKDVNRNQMNELIADDYMICKHGLDTNWGSTSYYSRYGIARPTSAQCSQLNNLFNTYF